MKNALRWILAHKIGFALSCIFLAGLFLRTWGISSVYQRIDDIPVAKQAFAVYQGFWSPDLILFYPIFFNYIVGILLKLASWFLSVIGANPYPGLYEFTLDQVLAIARHVSALLGALTILVVFKIGKKLFSETVALAAAFFFSVSFVHILYSHQIVLDVPMTFFYALALYFSVLILKEGRWSHYLGASLFAGLATATKYNGIFIVFSILMAHVWNRHKTQKNILKIFLDKRLWTSGFVALLSFFAGHPYALLWFESFIKASRTLSKLVHETEWYLVLIKPQTLWEKIAETKYVKGLWNVLSAEGLTLFLLIVLGLLWIFRRRNQETAFVALSGLIYFLGALGYLGFSRLRDLSTLALFYAFFAAFGLMMLRDLLQRRKTARAAFAVLAACAIVWISFRSLSKVTYLHEDDTTEIAERWVERNLPPGSFFGREWFTPELKNPGLKFRSFARPFLWKDFPAFDQFDFIEASSASHGFFLKYRKYYPEQVAVYDRLDHNHELLKDFYFETIEFKNPEVKIYSGKIARRPKARLSLPSVPADPNPSREFEIADRTAYGKDINGFFLRARESVERIFVSRARIPRLAVFIKSPEGAGEIAVRSGLRKKRIKVESGRDTFTVLEPRRSFPFFKYMYKVRLRASENLAGCFVKICHDDFDIAVEFFRSKDYTRAREFFLQALENPPLGTRDLEIHLYLAYCAKMTGRPDEERRHVEKFSGEPSASKLLSVYRSLDRSGWDREFEKYSGISVPLFLATQTILIDDDQFNFENGTALESESFLNRKAWQISPGGGGPLIAQSAEKRLPPQTYRAEFLFYNPSGIRGDIGEAEILVRKDGTEERTAFPLRLEDSGADRFSRAVLSFKIASYAGRIGFRLKLSKGAGVAFDRLIIAPDLRAFLADEFAMFQDYLK